MQRPSIGSIALALVLGCSACSSILGTRLERHVRIDVGPDIVAGEIGVTIRNLGSHAVLVHRDCMDRLRRVVGGVLEPPTGLACVAMYIPPTRIEPSGTLTVSVDVEDRPRGTYRAWFTLTDLGGTLPETSSLSEAFELP